VQQKIQRINAGHFESFDLSLHQMREVLFHRRTRQLGAQQRQKLGPAGDDADVGAVALVAAAAPGKPQQRHGPGGALRHRYPARFRRALARGPA